MKDCETSQLTHPDPRQWLLGREPITQFLVIYQGQNIGFTDICCQGRDWLILGLSAQMIVITLGLAVCTPLCLLSGCGWVVMVMVVWTVWTVWAPSGPGSCVLAAAVCRCESDSVPSSWLVSYSDTLTPLLQDICPPTVM